MDDTPNPRPHTTPLRRIGAVALLIAMTVPCAVHGFGSMFSAIRAYDDEGAMLIAIKQFNEGRPLYDEVYSMYGPLSFLMKRAICSSIGQPINHDVGRMICLAYWLATAATCAGAVYRLTRSFAATVVGFYLAYWTIADLVAEPGHPQELCGLLLGLGVLIATPGPSRRRIGPMVMGLGLVGGCLVMTKVNLGIFYAMALGMSLLAYGPRNAATRALTALYVACLLAAPSLLMNAYLDQSWCLQYDVRVTGSLVATLIMCLAGPRPQLFQARHWAVGAAGFVLAVVGIVGATWLSGSSLDRILYSNFVMGPKFGVLFKEPAPSDPKQWLTPLVAIAAAIVIVTGRRRFDRVVAILRVVGGLLLLAKYARSGPNPYLFYMGPPFAYLALIPPIGRERGASETFARAFLVFLAITQVMWGYPVWGTQQVFAILLCVVAAVICVHDGLTDLAEPAWPSAHNFLLRLAPGALAAALFLFTSQAAFEGIASYRSRVPLGLPGSRLVRLLPDEVARLRDLVERLRSASDTFLTLPGLNSFHLWTGLDPPTGFNLGNWMYLLTESQQALIIERLSKARRPCVLINRPMLEFWLRGRAGGSTLESYIRDEFFHHESIHGHEIWLRKPRAPAASTYRRRRDDVDGQPAPGACVLDEAPPTGDRAIGRRDERGMHPQPTGLDLPSAFDHVPADHPGIHHS